MLFGMPIKIIQNKEWMKLTNTQMNILAERVTDLLEEANKVANKEILESEEYIHFKDLYSDEVVTTLQEFDTTLNSLEATQEQIKDQIDDIKKKAFAINKFYNLGHNSWTSKLEPNTVLEGYLEKRKLEKYPGVEFNRDKTLRRAQADILLSNLGDVTAEELVNQLVNKLK